MKVAVRVFCPCIAVVCSFFMSPPAVVCVEVFDVISEWFDCTEPSCVLFMSPPAVVCSLLFLHVSSSSGVFSSLSSCLLQQWCVLFSFFMSPPAVVCSLLFLHVSSSSGVFSFFSFFMSPPTGLSLSPPTVVCSCLSFHRTLSLAQSYLAKV